MSDDNPFGDNMPWFDPSQMFAMFGDLSNMFSGLSGNSWATAKQIAGSIASGFDGSEDNVDPAARIAFEQLTRVAELQVQQHTGLQLSDSGNLTVRPATRQEWASHMIDAWRPVLETLGAKLSNVLAAEADSLPEDTGDPQQAMMNGVLKMLGPLMLSMTAGSMVGHLARRNLGGYDLPIPRHVDNELLVLHTNLEQFADEWSIPVDDVRMWVCLHEMTHHAVLRIPHVSDRLTRLLADYANAFRPDTAPLEERFRQLDFTDPSSAETMQAAMNDPELILGVMRSEHQQEILPYISALVATIEGWVDHVMDAIGSTLIGSYNMLSEAQRRRRITANPADRFVERMLGLELDRACYERGQAFIAGVVERAGEDRLQRLWESPEQLPTPNEVDAPGLWLARTDLELEAGDTADAEGTADPEPDGPDR